MTTTTPPHQPVLMPLYEKQRKVYPRAVIGRFARWRWAMVWLTQLVFYGLPWLHWNGRHAVLFDLDQRHFYVAGLVLQPQDFIYLAALLIMSALLLFFVTALAGRVWCGYACPQTVYTEIFLWLERRTEGDRGARMRLDAQPWGPAKLLRKGAKHGAWLAVALYTGFTFTGYFIPIESLAAQSMALTLSPWATFWVFFYGLATYGNAGFMREQVCKYMCPYARFQSALTDMDTLVIAYDTARGDPRGSRPRQADAGALGLGDCVDCTLCVQVCPTGIDIRNGLQNECIACAACIDVCDGVMGKMGSAPGLIRYASGRGASEGLSRATMLRRLWRPRVLVYGGLLLAVSVAFLWSLSHRSDFAASINKDRGAMARVVGRGNIENTYQLHLTNSSEVPRRYRIGVSGLPGLQLDSAAEVALEATGSETFPLRLLLPAEAARGLGGQSRPVLFEIQPEPAAEASPPRQIKAVFIVPQG